MSVIAGKTQTKSQQKLDEVEQIKRLIEIQTQIVQLAKQNELAERECEALRHELSQRISHPRGDDAVVPKWFRGAWRRMMGALFPRSHA